MLVRHSRATGRVLVALVTAAPVLPGARAFVSKVRELCPQVETIVQNINPRRSSAVLGPREKVLWGKMCIRDRRNHIENARFLCADAGEAARYLEGEGVRPDVVCVDPPRKGLAEDVVDTIADMGPQRVVYVSCDPGTLGRDVKRFAGRGYTLKKAVAVDMFPRTAHVETVARLERS